MSELQAAVALAQFEQLDSNSLCHNSTPNVETSMMYSHTHMCRTGLVGMRLAVALVFDRAIEGYEQYLQRQAEPLGCKSSYWAYTALLIWSVK